MAKKKGAERTQSAQHPVPQSDSEELSSVDDAADEGGEHDWSAGEAANGSTANGPPKKRSRSDQMYRAPAANEIRYLKETQQSFKSNLFRMQLSEQVRAVSLDYDKHTSLEATLVAVKETLEAIGPDTAPVQYTANTLPGVSIPRPPLCQSKVTMAFKPPSDVAVVGSFLLHTMARPALAVDLAVEMPKECFVANDEINYRYYAKRAAYVAVLARALSETDHVTAVRFAWLDNDPNRPIVVCTPTGASGTEPITIRVLPTFSPDMFKPQKLWPGRRNVRPDYLAKTGQVDADICSTALPIATPHYNQGIVADGLFREHVAYQHGIVGRNDALREAIVLLKSWLGQRIRPKGSPYPTSLGGFNGFVLSMLLCYLVDVGKANQKLSCYQFFRLTLDCLAKSDWTKEPLCMAADDVTMPPLSAFTDHYDVVLIDPTGQLNLCAGVTAHEYFEARHEARLTVDWLSTEADCFESVFGSPVMLLSKADHLIQISRLPPPTVLGKHEAVQAVADRGDLGGRDVARWLAALITKALSDRVTLVCVRQKISQSEWNLDQSPPVLESQGLTIGLLLDHSQWMRAVDKGPSPTDKEGAAQFRKFWGESVELRKFKDGSLCEVMTFEQPRGKETHVLQSIVEHVLERHTSMSPKALGMRYISNQLDGVITLPNVSGAEIETEEEAQRYVLNVFEALTRHVRSLQGLPLRVTSIQAISPALRRTAVFVPRKEGEKAPCKDLPTSLRPMEALLIMEQSSKWPDDLAIIQQAKTAFYLRMAEGLEVLYGKKMKEGLGQSGTHSGFYESLPMTVEASAQCLKVVKGGLAFTFTIVHPREEYVIRTIAKEPIAAHSHTLLTQRLPRHSLAVSDLATKHASYSATVRLFKRWLASHLFSDYVTDEAAELIVAHVYLHPAPYAAPHSPWCAFYRVLGLVASYDWDREPLIVDIDQSLTAEDTTAVQDLIREAHAKHSRTTLPAMFLATPLDKIVRDRSNTGPTAPGESGLIGPWLSPWTKGGRPSALILKRLIGFAAASVRALDASVVDLTKPARMVEHIFVTPLTEYSALIHLNTSALPNAAQRLFAGKNTEQGPIYRNLVPIEKPRETVIGLDPVRRYLETLRAHFSQYALFFNDQYGGDVIGVVWLPKTSKATSFSIGSAHQSMPVNVQTSKPAPESKLNGSLLPNLPGIAAQMKLLGDGLVERVEFQ